MAERKKSKLGRTAVWIIIGILMLGMVGFGAVGLSGSSRSLGKVGDKQLGVDLFVQSLRQETAQFEQQIGRRLTAPEIQNSGLDQRALARAVSQRALDNHLVGQGISMGDARVSEQVQAIPAFAGLGGAFDETAYKNVLRANNLNSRDFEDSIRETGARDALRSSILKSIKSSPKHAEALAHFLLEQRDFDWAAVDKSLLITGVPVATDADLQTYYDENAQQFEVPATKVISYVLLQPETLAETIEVSTQDIRALYDARIDEYKQPERRIVDRLIMPTAEDAVTAMIQISAGQKTFEDVVAERGLDVATTELGIVTRKGLGVAGPSVFAAPDTGVYGPFETDLGPAVFRVNAILNAQETPFEAVQDDLRIELGTIKALEAINDETDAIDDLLAGGATLEDVANETSMELGQIDWNVAVSSGIAAFAEFRDAAQALGPDDFPELASLTDGGLFAIRLDKNRDAAIPSFDDAKDQVQAAWDQAAELAEMKTLAATLADKWKTSDAAALGLSANSETDVTRSDFIENAPPALVASVFELADGETTTVNDGVTVFVAKLNRSTPADLASPEAAALLNIMSQQLDAQLQDDVFTAYADAVRETTDINIDAQMVQSVLTSVHGG